MNDLPIPLLLLILGAIIQALQFTSKEAYTAIKNKIVKDKKRKEDIKSDYQKAKEVLKVLEDLNEKEDLYKDRENKRMLDNNMSILMNQQKASEIINEIILNTEVDRFVLFHTHNGNGQPNYFKPYKVSYLQYNAVDPSHINRYQNIEVDAEYTRMLIEIQENMENKLPIVFENMPECLLKSIYKKEKIKYAEVYFLCATSTGIIYTSLSTYMDIKEYTKQKEKITLAISKLKAIYTEERSRVFKDVIIREENETRLKEIYISKEKLKETLKE
jgi:hypothetical protein